VASTKDFRSELKSRLTQAEQRGAKFRRNQFRRAFTDQSVGILRGEPTSAHMLQRHVQRKRAEDVPR